MHQDNEKERTAVEALATARDWETDCFDWWADDHGGIAVECGCESWVIYLEHSDALAAVAAQLKDYLEEDIGTRVPVEYRRYLDIDEVAKDRALEAHCNTGLGAELATYDGEEVELQSRGGNVIGSAFRRN